MKTIGGTGTGRACRSFQREGSPAKNASDAAAVTNTMAICVRPKGMVAEGSPFKIDAIPREIERRSRVACDAGDRRQSGAPGAAVLKIDDQKKPHPKGASRHEACRRMKADLERRDRMLCQIPARSVLAAAMIRKVRRSAARGRRRDDCE